MKTNNFEAHEYKTPVCKVVEVHVDAIICVSQLESWEQEDI